MRGEIRDKYVPPEMAQQQREQYEGRIRAEAGPIVGDFHAKVEALFVAANEMFFNAPSGERPGSPEARQATLDGLEQLAASGILGQDGSHKLDMFISITRTAEKQFGGNKVGQE